MRLIGVNLLVPTGGVAFASFSELSSYGADRAEETGLGPAQVAQKVLEKSGFYGARSNMRPCAQDVPGILAWARTVIHSLRTGMTSDCEFVQWVHGENGRVQDINSES
jgi:hypothetical protein